MAVSTCTKFVRTIHLIKLTTVPTILNRYKTRYKDTKRMRPNSIRKNISDFARSISIQGLKYLKGSTYKFDKIHSFLLTCIMIFVFATCFLLIHKAWMKQCQNDMQTIVLESSEYGNDFPSVTFCPQRPMVEEKIDKVLEKLILPTGVRASRLRHNIRHYYEFLAQTEIDNVTIFEMIDILKINNMTLNDLINDLISPCESFLRSCYFDEEKISCRYYFKKIMAARRYCCTFNSRFYFNENKDAYRLKAKSVNYSPYSGLVLRFNENRFENNINNNETKKSGLNENEILIYVLNSYESLSDTFVSNSIQPGKEMHIQVEVSVKYVKKDLHSHCVNGDVEKRPYVPFYSVSNCKLSSKIQQALQRCNCIPYFYAYGLVNHSKEICDVKETTCLNGNYNSIWGHKQNIKDYYNSVCPPTCKIVSLQKTCSVIPINGGDFACSRIYENIMNRSAILRVYLKAETSSLFKREDVNSKVDYFAYLSCIYSLCLGSSVMCIFKVLCFVGLFINFFY